MDTMLAYHQQLRRPNWAVTLECFLSRYINYLQFGWDDNTELDLIHEFVAIASRIGTFEVQWGSS